VAGERGGVGHDDVVAEQAIMSRRGLRHEKTVVADLCDSAAAFGAAMNGDEFPNAICDGQLMSGFLRPQISDPVAADRSRQTGKCASHR
jgi:hypothetical protein